MLSRRHAMLACALAMSACEVETEEELEERTFTVNTGWGCHSCDFKNSPSLGKHALSEFSVGVQLSDFMLRFIEAPNGQRYKALVSVHRIEADTPTGIKHGAQILDWWLIFEKKGIEHRVKILDYEQHPDWAGGDLIDTYSLGYLDPAHPESPLSNVCPALPFEDTTIVFIPGETYVDATKTVKPNQANKVTVACRGHAVMKLKFLGHDPNDNYGSTWEDRQGTLKMLTADYCGNGKSYTKFGQELDWQDELGNFAVSPTVTQTDLEARFDEFGAMCLNEPRNTDIKRTDVACTIPWCGGAADDLDGARWATYHVP